MYTNAIVRRHWKKNPLLGCVETEDYWIYPRPDGWWMMDPGELDAMRRKPLSQDDVLHVPKNGDVDIEWLNGYIIRVGPYRLRVLEDGPMWGDGHLVAVPDTIHSAFTYAPFQLQQWLYKIYIRIILTLAVWGLTDRVPTTPSWKDLKIFRRFR